MVNVDMVKCNCRKQIEVMGGILPLLQASRLDGQCFVTKKKEEEVCAFGLGDWVSSHSVKKNISRINIHWSRIVLY